MIEACTGLELGRLLDRIETESARYRHIVVCSPYIDGYMADRLRTLCDISRANNCAMRIITTSASAATLNKTASARRLRGDVVVRSDLHAKVYLAVGRRVGATEAIVTSANLTRAGTERNIEFGFRVSNSTIQGRDLIRQIHGFLSDTAA